MKVQRLAIDYSKELTTASFSALLELMTALRHYRDSLTLIGGWVPFLLIDEFGPREADFSHVGSIDIDLAVDPEKVGTGEYSEIVAIIATRGYQMRTSEGLPIPFSFQKVLKVNANGPQYTIQVDFLTCKQIDTGRHRHRNVQPTLKARIAEGCDLAFSHNFKIRISGKLPGNGETDLEISILNISGCLGMKGIVLGERYKEKDAYDIFSVVSQCLEGPTDVAEQVQPEISNALIKRGIDVIRSKFRNQRAEGPSWVAEFLGSNDPDLRDRIQAEAYVLLKEFIDHIS